MSAPNPNPTITSSHPCPTDNPNDLLIPTSDESTPYEQSYNRPETSEDYPRSPPPTPQQPTETQTEKNITGARASVLNEKPPLEKGVFARKESQQQQHLKGVSGSGIGGGGERREVQEEAQSGGKRSIGSSGNERGGGGGGTVTTERIRAAQGYSGAGSMGTEETRDDVGA